MEKATWRGAVRYVFFSENHSDDESKNNEMSGHVAGVGESRGAYSILVGKTEGKRTLGIPRCKWKHNIKMDFQEIEWRHALD